MKIRMLALCVLFAVFFAGTAYAANLDISLLNQDPDPARAGEIVEVRFMVENLGSAAANNVKVELVPQYPFSKIPGENYESAINSLAPYQQGSGGAVLKYRVMVDNEASEGAQKIKLSYGSGGSTKVTESFDIDIRGTEFAQIIYIDKAKLYPGQETELKFTITNVGTSPLKSLIFSWDEADGVILPVYSDDTKYIGLIGIGESVELRYTVVADVNANPGLYQLDLNLKYETESSSANEINTQAGVFVGGGTDFDVTFSESTEGQTSLSVANVGGTSAMSVTVRIPEQEGFTVVGSRSSIVGNLDKGDYTIVSFQIAQAPVFGGAESEMPAKSPRDMTDAERQALRERFTQAGSAPSGANNLDVVIEYTDTTGLRQTLEKTVPIQFRSLAIGEDGQISSPGQFGGRMGAQPTSWTSRLTTPAIAAVILVGGFVYFKKRKAVNAALKKALKKKE